MPRIPTNFTPHMAPSAYAAAAIPLNNGVWDVISDHHKMYADVDHLTPSGTTRNDTTSDAPDLIFASHGDWDTWDTIDGGGGIDTIRGFFPRYDAGFAPTVSSVERAELMPDSPNGGWLDLSHWTGLHYLDVDGSLDRSFRSHITFTHIGHETTQLAINDFVGDDVAFRFADGVAKNQTEDLYLRDVGGSGRYGTHVDGLEGLKQLNIHASGHDNVEMLLPKHVAIDGAGNLTLGFQLADAHGATLDASHATGNLHLINEGQSAPATIMLGSGRDIYEADMEWNSGLTTIKGFHVGQDQLNLHNNNVHFDPHQAGALDIFGTYEEAADFVAKHNHQTGAASIDVFEWKGSTYAFLDQHLGHQAQSTDAFIKLENVTHVGVHEFAGLLPDVGEHQVPSHGLFG